MKREDLERGFVVEACRGAADCPRRAVEEGAELARELERALAALDPAGRIRAKAGGHIRAHDCFRVSVSCCPNACSRPQIADVGFIGAAEVAVTDEACLECEACLEACREDALRLDMGGPILDPRKCVRCGACAAICPSRTLAVARTGWRALFGGRLGRHPRLAVELPGLYSTGEAVALAVRCLALHLDESRPGERFGALLERLGPERAASLARG